MCVNTIDKISIFIHNYEARSTTLIEHLYQSMEKTMLDFVCILF